MALTSEVTDQAESTDTAPLSHTSISWRMFALSFSALFLELMVIRWVPSVVRLVAYYANLMLLSSFLGLGIGALTSTRKWRLFGWFPWLLAVNIGTLLLCRYIVLPGSTAEMRFYATEPHLLNYLVLVCIFATNASVFVPFGQQIGLIFNQLPRLKAYAWDLAGSLCGTLCFGFFSLTHFSPMLGMTAVMLIYLGLHRARYWMWHLPVFGLILFGMFWANDRAAIWSPYYYITIHSSTPDSPAISEPVSDLQTRFDPPLYVVKVNHDFYQVDGTLDVRRYTPGSAAAQLAIYHQEQYLIPYYLCAGRNRVLVVGAGGGNDVQAALRSGVQHVDAVEIDPVLVSLSRRFNSGAPYDDPRVTVRVNDARAFLRKATPGYDLVVFGFLDSQALFTCMNNIRLDGFIYTVESFRTAYSLLNENGLLSVSFLAGQESLARKLYSMVETATGKAPIAYNSDQQIILVVPRGKHAAPPAQMRRWQLVTPENLTPMDLATDDWPFLYLSKRTIPTDYLVVIASLLVLSLGAVIGLRGGRFGTRDGHFCFLGIGFLLMETKSISDCSLYFGATWLVTTIVVAGVLLMVCASNLMAMRLRRLSLLMYVPLFAVLVALYMVPRDSILALPLAGRLLWTLFAVPLPIFFAGLIFSTTFHDAASPSMFFGANLIGAMIGGFCEYLGMATGNHNLALLVIGAYLGSLVCLTATASTAGTDCVVVS